MKSMHYGDGEFSDPFDKQKTPDDIILFKNQIY